MKDQFQVHGMNINAICSFLDTNNSHRNKDIWTDIINDITRIDIERTWITPKVHLGILMASYSPSSCSLCIWRHKCHRTLFKTNIRRHKCHRTLFKTSIWRHKCHRPFAQEIISSIEDRDETIQIV